jgi:mannosyltransferase
MSSSTAPAVRPAADDPATDPPASLPQWAVVGLAFTLTASVVLRFLALSPMWIDEAQTVEIARRSWSGLLSALRHDGSPPFYYLLLHAWMKVFGTGAFAARALSGVLSVAALPLIWRVARHLGASRRNAWVAVLLLATNPFAIRYATEARMYSLVVLLWLLAFLAFRQVWLNGGVRWIAAAALVTAVLLLTHYWSLFLAAVVGLTALVVVRRRRRPALRVIAALVIGAFGLLPWLPSLLFQLRHTGAPWGSPPSLATAFLTPTAWAGQGPVGTADVLTFVYYLLLLFALVGTATATGVHLGGRPHKPAVWVIGIAVATMLLGCVVNFALGSAYASRYSSVALVPFLLAVAAGFSALPARWWLPAVATVTGLALVVSAALPAKARSQADEVVAALRGASPRDLVVFCPDQLGPAVHRLAPRLGQQVVYPTMGSPAMVDWVDYEARNDAADPQTFARRVLARAGSGGAIWLVYSEGYPTFNDDCSRLLVAFGAARGQPRIVVHSHQHVDERERVAFYAPR